jgi:hypothetical protein
VDLATTLFAQAGDTVVVEEPTYYLIESIFRDHGLQVVGVATDEDGLDVDAFEEMLENGSRLPAVVHHTHLPKSQGRGVAVGAWNPVGTACAPIRDYSFSRRGLPAPALRAGSAPADGHAG